MRKFLTAHDDDVHGCRELMEHVSTNLVARGIAVGCHAHNCRRHAELGHASTIELAVRSCLILAESVLDVLFYLFCWLC